MYLATIGTMVAQVVLVQDKFLDFEDSTEPIDKAKYARSVPRNLPIVILALTVATAIFAALDYAMNNIRQGWLTSITVALGQPAYLLQLVAIVSYTYPYEGVCSYEEDTTNANICFNDVNNVSNNAVENMELIVSISFAVFACQSVSNAIQLGAIFNTGRFSSSTSTRGKSQINYPTLNSAI